ncbi:hypothetical protein [Cellulomonas composti]|uniref:TFIIS-type domain-containing protein n=1 Tax=Cellulomonas composti TaxID=266130 RepID=A0A511JBG9_9CELL|nr:hypothetical protein [Cellulomonas composti]GEL95149.1 hypothetical protein CCO02nite_18070 [Cellulomonas composti]
MARRKGDAARARAAAAAEPLGSMSQATGPLPLGTEVCLRCGSDRLTRIRMGLTDGRPAYFVSCPACEQTNWFALEGDGTPLSKDEVTGPG